MFNWIHEHILTLLVFCPLVFAGLNLFLSDLKAIKWLSLLGAGLTFLLSCHVWYYFNEHTPELQFVEH